MTELNVSATGAGQPVTQPEVRDGNSSGGGQLGAVDFTASRVPTSDKAFGKSGLIITKGDVKAAQDELGMRTSAKTKERVANIHNKYARTILAMAGNDPALRAIANAHIAELPMASYKRDLAEYTHACQAKLDAFRADAQRLGLSESLVILDANADERAVLAEGAASVRHQETLSAIDGATTTITGAIDEARTDINNHTDKDGEATRRQVRRTGNSVIRKVNAHTTAETNRGISANAQNTSAIVGVDAPGYTVTDPVTGKRLLNNGRAVEAGAVELVNEHTTKAADRVIEKVNGHTDEQADRVIKEVNDHTTKEVGKIQLTQQQTQVLLSKRQTISDMLTTEQTEAGFGFGAGLGVGISSGQYRDNTIKWIGSAADRVMADSELSFEKKQEALDELIRMVNEENVISDADKAEFEGKYFYDTREHRHI